MMQKPNDSNRQPAIRLHQLRKVYPRGLLRPSVEAVRDINLVIEPGEAFGFIGPNGAGKSTTIRMLVGAMRPTSGRAEIYGISAEQPEARRSMAYVPENPCLHDALTPMEILRMGLRLHGCQVADDVPHCINWLDRFDLKSVAHSPIRSFSKGMVQRTALAHALAIQPRLLILDEPLSGLDPLGRRTVVDILENYRRNGGTLFFSSHVLHDVERIADRFGLIRAGQLVTVRSPRELAADQADQYVVHYRGGIKIEKSTEIRPGLYALDSPAPILAELIAQVQALGGCVQDVAPKISLESAFFRTTQAEKEQALPMHS